MVLCLVVLLILDPFAFECAGANCPTVPYWIEVGPGPLFISPANDTDGKGPDAGMVRDIAIDPSGTTDQVIYLGTDSGGVWKTTDGGTNWTPLTDFLPSPNIGAVALDPANPAIVYAGSGNAANQFGSSIGAGIYKSLDGGQTWIVEGVAAFTNQAINRIVLPAPNLLLVASSAGVFRSIDGGSHFGNNPPAFDDNSPVLFGNATDLDVDTTSSSTIYASIWGLGVFKSTDAGVTFPASGNLFSANNGAPLNATYITFAQSTRPDNHTMYVQVGFPATPAGYPAGLYKSSNAGGNWSTIPLSTGSDSGAVELGYAQTVGVDPQDANRVFIGDRALYEATDGGAAGISGANRIDKGQVHADQHALIFSPASHWSGPAPTRLYNGSDGGIATTANAGPNATWTILNGIPACLFGNGALATVLFRQIDIGRGTPANNAYTYGVAQDLGVSAHQPNCVGTPWFSGSGGDGISIAVDPLNPQHAIVALNGGWRQTFDGGQSGVSSWQTTVAGLPAALPNQPFTGLVYFDPNGGRVYAVALGTQLFQSADNGNNFTYLYTFPANISAIGMSPADSASVWIGLADGTVQRSTNALSGSFARWLGYTIPNSPPGAVSGIAVDPNDAAQVVVVYRATSSSVFRTGNGGASWTMMAGDLPAIPVNAVVIDPNTTPHAILVATDTGVMQTLDFGSHWNTLGTGLPIVHCTSLALDASAVPSLVRVGTYGRSSFELAYDRLYVNWQNSGMQDGSRQNPFQTVLQGVNAPASGAVRYVNIQAGSYAESPVTYNQCCTLNALNGAVTIH